ncbi:MAG: hypothetical protein LBN24_11630 [Mediterranea sp.]|nr:hypothetical protein [Mediterranea sp.]
MKKNYYLPGLNKPSNKSMGQDTNKDSKWSEWIKKETMPQTWLFIDDPNLFYRKYAPSLNRYKMREKRLLDFETPNRALITHEYDIQIEKGFDYKKYYYLFNPATRLSWLKIWQQDNKRLSNASQEQVKAITKKILWPELFSSCHYPERRFEELWKEHRKKERCYPCFVKLEKEEGSNFLLSVSYYDSIKKEEREEKDKEDKRKNKLKRVWVWTCQTESWACNKLSILFCPLEERRIEYGYYPLAGKSSWLYIKAPNNFNIEYKHHTSEKGTNQIAGDNSTSRGRPDLDKLSLTIINNNKTDSVEVGTVRFYFDITVPATLKIWFNILYYSAFLTTALLLANVLNILYLKLEWPIIFDCDLLGALLSTDAFKDLVLALAGAIITTRGWMIHEETVLKKYSILITWYMSLILLFYLIYAILTPR